LSGADRAAACPSDPPRPDPAGRLGSRGTADGPRPIPGHERNAMHSLLAQGSGGGSSLITLLVFALPLGLLFVFMRNQQKRVRTQQALQQSAEVGGEVLTTSGMFGAIVAGDEDGGTVSVELADGPGARM